MVKRQGDYINKYYFFVSLFVSLVSLVFSICLVYIAVGSSAMVQPFPKLVWALLGIAFVALIFVIYNGMRIYTAHKDTRLDSLINNATALTAEIQSLKAKIDELTTKMK
jgi:peptidoglycan hydrolase CwlO-like protein